MKRQSAIATALFFLLFSVPCAAAPAIDPTLARLDEESAIAWYDIRLLDIEGQGWADESTPFTRLPDRAQEKVREPVGNLSRHSTGLCVRFNTDASEIHAKWELRSARLAMPHMAATGVSGLDLYVRDDTGVWRWLAVGRPTEQTNSKKLVSGIPPGKREYLLYLPLYNGVASVEIGLPIGKTLAKAAPYPAGHKKPLVFYGTSITQGGCASRTGMVHTAILGRRLNSPVVNLGFSGNGRMEAEVATLMAELDAAVFVIDCLPNIAADQVRDRTEPLVRILRETHPDTPILLVEDRTYSGAFLISSQQNRNNTSRAELRAAFQRLLANGVKYLYYLEGDGLLGEDNLGTVDGSHPTDLGFMRQANVFEEALRPILGPNR